MNEDEKKKAIDILAAHIRETRPYLSSCPHAMMKSWN